jgi:GDPmannose 4,6-dehydratase
LNKGYEVFGTTTNVTKPENLERIKHILDHVKIFEARVDNTETIKDIFKTVMPDEVYHLASRVEARLLFAEEKDVFQANFFGGFNLLQAIVEFKKEAKFYCAGSSLMFGSTKLCPQNELTSMNPSTPYGIAKVACYNYLKMYRESYGLFACMGILYNHESVRRNEFFLPRKISKAVAHIHKGLQSKLILGDIEPQRDWSFAGDVVESMWLMLQQPRPEDFVIGSGELHSIRELLDIAFETVGLNWNNYVETDQKLFRKVEYTNNLCADISKAKQILGWKPKIQFKELIQTMVQHDVKLLETT